METTGITLLTKWKAVNAIACDAAVGPLDGMIYLRLLYHHNAKKDACFPSLEKIAGSLNISVRRVRSGLRALEQVGYVKTHFQCGRSRTNRYLLGLRNGEHSGWKTGTDVHENRIAGSPNTMKEKEKKKTEVAGEEICQRPHRTDASKASVAVPRTAEALQGSLARALAHDAATGWTLLMEVPRQDLDHLCESYAAGRLDVSGAFQKVKSILDDRSHR